jgi:DNA integrity scanning protein DisA with diadenylate cyclase activity
MPGVTVAQRDALVAAGFVTAADIRAATDEQLDAVDGIGPETVKKLREATKV